MSSRDDINKLYSSSKKLEKAKIFLFYLDIICAVLSLIVKNDLYIVCVVMQIILAILYFACNIVDDGIFWYEAEKFRRKDNIQVAFDTRLSELNTEGYYNNDLKPSIEKYALNTLESNYFSKEISKSMLLKSSIKTLVAIIVLICSCIFLKDIQYIFIITQTIFSTYICTEFVMLILYMSNMRKLYDEAYNELIIQGIRKNSQKIWLSSYILEYEAVKAHFKIRLDSKVFNKQNERLSKEWD